MFWKWSQRPFPVAPDERSPPPSRYTQERGPGNGHRWHHWTWMPRIRIHSQKLQVMVVLQVNNLIWVLGLRGTGVASYPQSFRQILTSSEIFVCKCFRCGFGCGHYRHLGFSPLHLVPSPNYCQKGRHVAALLPKYITNSASQGFVKGQGGSPWTHLVQDFPLSHVCPIKWRTS